MPSLLAVKLIPQTFWNTKRYIINLSSYQVIHYMRFRFGITLLISFLFLSIGSHTKAQESVSEVDPNKPLIKSVFFGGGSYYIDGEQVDELKDFLGTIPDINMYTITIHSHTDNIGGMEYNAWLSQMRSESVAYELIMQNVPGNSIHIKDFGQGNPSFNNQSYRGRLMNRRVDIIFEQIVF